MPRKLNLMNTHLTLGLYFLATKTGYGEVLAVAYQYTNGDKTSGRSLGMTIDAPTVTNVCFK
jgi:hypothetical protein